MTKITVNNLTAVVDNWKNNPGKDNEYQQLHAGRALIHKSIHKAEHFRNLHHCYGDITRSGLWSDIKTVWEALESYSFAICTNDDDKIDYALQRINNCCTAAKMKTLVDLDLYEESMAE